jgi:histidyl-tRNA synthetase
MLEDYREIGSIASGGRYENLASNFTDMKFPGVGGSIGLTRLFFVLREYNLINMTVKNPVDYVILPITPDEHEASFKLADKLRQEGKTVDVDLSERKLSDKFNRAGKIADFAIVIGNDEVTNQKFTAKNLQTGEITEL